MKPEQQVTNLDISKRLKELGVRQDSYFYWVENATHDGFDLQIGPKHHLPSLYWSCKWYSAFTVAELGEMLMKIKFADFGTFPARDNKIAVYTGEFLRKTAFIDTQFEADTEADARGKMLIYLLENNLIKS